MYGQQHLHRPVEQEHRDRRGDQRDPDPAARADEGDPLTQLGRERRAVLAVPVERVRISAIITAEAMNVPASIRNASPGPITATTMPPIAGTDQEAARLAHELLQGVGLDELLARQDVRHDRRHRGPEERLARRVHDDAGDQVPELQLIGHGEHADQRQDRGADDVGGDHHAPALEVVADHAAAEQEQRHPDRPGQADERERRGHVRQLVDLPRDRDEVDAVADQRDDESAPQQGEVALAQWTQDLHRVRGALSSLVMLVAIDGPAGAGKSTVARAAADALGFTYLDTGAMYRCVALARLRDPQADPAALDIRVGATGAARRRGRHGRDPRSAGQRGRIADRRRPAGASGDARHPARTARQWRLGRRGSRHRHGRRPRRRAEDLPHRVAAGARPETFGADRAGRARGARRTASPRRPRPRSCRFSPCRCR